MSLVEKLRDHTINPLLLEAVGSQFQARPTLMTLDRAKARLGGLDASEVQTLQEILTHINAGEYDWSFVKNVALLLEVREYTASEAAQALLLT